MALTRRRVSDFPLTVPVTCAATPDTTVGGTCSVDHDARRGRAGRDQGGRPRLLAARRRAGVRRRRGRPAVDVARTRCSPGRASSSRRFGASAAGSTAGCHHARSCADVICAAPRPRCAGGLPLGAAGLLLGISFGVRRRARDGPRRADRDVGDRVRRRGAVRRHRGAGRRRERRRRDRRRHPPEPALHPDGDRDRPVPARAGGRRAPRWARASSTRRGRWRIAAAGATTSPTCSARPWCSTRPGWWERRSACSPAT